MCNNNSSTFLFSQEAGRYPAYKEMVAEYGWLDKCTFISCGCRADMFDLFSAYTSGINSVYSRKDNLTRVEHHVPSLLRCKVILAIYSIERSITLFTCDSPKLKGLTGCRFDLSSASCADLTDCLQ